MRTSNNAAFHPAGQFLDLATCTADAGGGTATRSVGELVARLGVPQPKVSNHLACLRWCGFVEARREQRTVLNQIADERVIVMLDLAHALLADNEEHVAACCRIEDQ